MSNSDSETRPLVSLGLPVYNGDNYLESSLMDILAQDYPNMEVVICDNDSSDGTKEICERLAQSDSRIKFQLNETNIGGFRNNNKVIDESRGEFFLLTGHDDRRDPRQISMCIDALIADKGASMCYTNTIYIDENGDRLDYSENIMDYSSESPSVRFAQAIRPDHKVEPVYGVVRASALEGVRFGLFADSDRVWISEFALKGRFIRLEEELFFRRDHPNKSTRAFESRYARIGWYDPGREVLFRFPYFRQLAEYFLAVIRSDVSVSEKMKCVRVLASWMLSNRRHLIGDIVYSTKAVLRPIALPIKRAFKRLF